MEVRGSVTQKGEEASGELPAREEAGRELTRPECGYDRPGRLISDRKVLADGSVLVTQWGYDANGNRVEEVTSNGDVVVGSYDEQDRLLGYGEVSFTYTHNGELFSKCQGSACQHFTYDVFGSLRQVALDNGQVIEYLVDGRNRRVGKRIDGVLVQGWLYDDQLRIVAELDGQNTVVARFIYADGINVPELMEKGGRTYRLIKDHLGSARYVVDIADGTIAQEMRYDAWGNVMYDSNPGFQPFGFAGGFYDPQTRLVRFGARDYDASIGRWLAKDPVIKGRPLTHYKYAADDPVNNADPFGAWTLPNLPPWKWKACVLEVVRSYYDFVDRSYGTNDALKHCVLSCLIALRCGLGPALVAGAWKELADALDKGHQAESRDFWNDLEGIDCAMKKNEMRCYPSDWVHCHQCCRCKHLH